jgi:hypothetical protein
MKKPWVAVIACLLHCASAQAQTCSYDTYTWNTTLQRAVAIERVEKPYSAVQDFERDAMTGCSVCEQDQREVQLPGLPAFRICQVFADALQQLLPDLIARGARIDSVTGYRVGMTRGDADADGNRTLFSNHSFGIALDINEGHNGLYDQCLQFDGNCRLLRGGAWQPGVEPFSLSGDGIIVQALQSLGLSWGGEIAGRQKDFMHFSPTGY